MFVKIETHGELLTCMLVESVRTPKGPRHNVKAYLGSITVLEATPAHRLRRFWLLFNDRLEHVDGLSAQERREFADKVAERIPRG